MRRYFRSTNFACDCLTDWRSSMMRCNSASDPAWPTVLSARAGDVRNETAAAPNNARMKAAFRRIGLFPKVIEVEPVVGRRTAVMLEPFHIVGQGPLCRRVALANRHPQPIGETFEMDVVAPAAPVKSEHQDDRAPQHGGDLERADRKRRRFAEKGNARLPFMTETPIREHADKAAALDGRFDLEHGIGPPQGNDLDIVLRVDGVEHRIDLARILFVHDENDAQLGFSRAQAAQHLETAEMRAHQQAALAARQQFVGEFLAGDMQVEDIRLAVEQKDPVQRAGGEGVVMAERIPEARRAAEHLRQIALRGAPGRGREDQEIETDRIKQQPRREAAEPQRDPNDELDERGCAALAPRHPFGGRLTPIAHRGKAPRRSVPVAAGWSGAKWHWNLIWPEAPFSQRSVTPAPGRTGRRNLTDRISKASTPLPADAPIAPRTSSNKTAPGMIGLPGKWPWAAG